MELRTVFPEPALQGSLKKQVRYTFLADEGGTMQQQKSSIFLPLILRCIQVRTRLWSRKPAGRSYTTLWLSNAVKRQQRWRGNPGFTDQLLLLMAVPTHDFISLGRLFQRPSVHELVFGEPCLEFLQFTIAKRQETIRFYHLLEHEQTTIFLLRSTIAPISCSPLSYAP